MPLTVSKFRENIYRILDQVLENGKPEGRQDTREGAERSHDH